MESMQRRTRHLIPAGLSPRRRVMAACAVLILLAHLLLAQLTLGLALGLTVTGRVSRWRRWWLAAPAAAGLVWALAIGPAPAGAGFAVGPAHVFDYLSRGDLLERLSRPAGLFAGAGSWLPRQLPVAMIAAAAEAALIGWLDWLRTDESTARPRRPGVIAAVRARLAASLIRAGAVVTRDGCALGVDPATGAQVELRWPEAAGGVLVTGAADRDVTVAGLQMVHAALRRRKPLIVIDGSADAAIARALAAACAATGTALRHERADADLGPVIIERSAALLRVGSPESAARACAGVTALAAGLRRIGVDGDGLVWVTGGERLTAQAVAALIGDGRACGLAVMVGAASSASSASSASAASAAPAVTAELAGLVSALLVHRIADPSLATTLAAQAGPRLSARALLTLGQGEFALAVKAPRPRLVAPGRSVPARLPRYTDVRQERVRRRLRYGPA
jgi:hypothetical protein